MRKESIQAQLEEYTWQWYGVMKAEDGIPTDSDAQLRFDIWISDLRRMDGGEDFRWFRTLKPGMGGGNRHFHFVLGGLLRNRRNYWQQRWNASGGEAIIAPYNPDQNGILHLLKKMDLGGDLRCDFELPKKHSGSMVGKERQESESGPRTVRLDGIDDMVTTAELRKLFRPFGRVLEIAITESRVNNDRTLLCAAVTMEDALSAEEAAVELQQLQLRGKEMEISIVGGH